MRNLRSMLVTGAAVGAAAVGGGAIANAATSITSTSSRTTPPAPAQGATAPGQGGHAFNPSQGGHTFGGRTETLLTGQTAAKVRAAALAKVSGTVQRVETNVDDSAPYEAHIVKSDGSQVIVEVNRDFTVSAVQTMGGHP
jgi:hypothetical protein